MRRDGVSVTLALSDVPRVMRPLVKDLNAMIDGELGHIVADDRHFSASGVTGSDTSDDEAESPVYENTPATPVTGGSGPKPELSLSCYGSGTRQSGDESASGVRAGPVVFDGLARRGDGRVLRTEAVVEPGAAVIIAVAPRDRGRAGLRFRSSSTVRVVRLEGCSDTTTGGGAARFEGGVVRRGKGCVALDVYAGGDVIRRRVGC